jgi:uncharacterized membrane-anchored protein YhcB (DUF1043 family)
MAFKPVVMRVSPSVYKKLSAIKFELEHERQRQVSYTEVAEELVAHYQATAQLLRDVKAAGQ